MPAELEDFPRRPGRLVRCGVWRSGSGGGGARERKPPIVSHPATRTVPSIRAATPVTKTTSRGREVLGTRTFVIVADPADVAIRIYQACGFIPREAQLSFDRPPAAEPSG